MIDNKSFQILHDCVKGLHEYYKNKNLKGKCFKTAFEIFLFLAERKLHGRLAHANITMGDKTLGHAWVEYEDIVFDFTLQQDNWIQDKNEYYEFAKIQKIVKYSGGEIQELIKLYGDKIVWVDWIIYNED
jgi:hypothetical protein